MEAQGQVEEFLSRLKEAVGERPYILVERAECEQYMAGKALSMGMLTAMVVGLKPDDCRRGPTREEGSRSGRAWTVAEFMPVYRGDPLFLKVWLSPADEAGRTFVKVNIEKRVDED